MVHTKSSKSAEIRARLKHPVIDADGHAIELTPVLTEYVRQVGGSQMAERYRASFESTVGFNTWYPMSDEERQRNFAMVSAWWGLPTGNTLDRATVSLPRLLHARMDELGIDYSVLYPTWALGVGSLQDEELRRVACRAMNIYQAEIYRPYADRMTPVAAIPTYTPQEAIEELEHAVKVLGLKAIVLAGLVRRPVPQSNPGAARRPFRLDSFGLESEYDYDPLWAKCLELGVSPTFHTGSMGVGTRQMAHNYMYNHIGHFAVGGEALCKSLFMGGVTRRFPTLKFAFLEGGVAWACSLYADLIGHWKKRNERSILRNLDPARLDQTQLLSLMRQYGEPPMLVREQELQEYVQLFGDRERMPHARTLDDFAACTITRAEEIRDLFVPQFYFGCEADDPMNAWAFNTKINPFGARLRAMSSSDMGHWDVPDMREVVEEMFELVEDGVMNEGDFQDFVFTNPASLWAGTNPGFFAGTRIESDVARAQAAGRL